MSFKLSEIHSQLINNEKLEQYSKSIELIDQTKVLKDKVINSNNQLIEKYLLILHKLFLQWYDDNEKVYFDLIEFTDSIQWNYCENIESDIAFFKIINVFEKSENNFKNYYKKYVEKINSYPNSLTRVKWKNEYSIILSKRYYKNREKIIQYLNEALIDIEEFENNELKLEIITNLGNEYNANGQDNLASKIFREGLKISKLVVNKALIKEFYRMILAGISYNQFTPDEYSIISSEYYEISIKDGDYWEILNSIKTKITLFSASDNPDSLMKYIESGIFYKQQILKNCSYLAYLSLISTIYEIIDQSRETGIGEKLLEPIREYHEGYGDENESIKLIHDEFVYLKDFDYSLISEIEKYNDPISFFSIYNNSIYLKQYWDNEFLSLENFKSYIKVLLNPLSTDREWSYYSAFFKIKQRIEDIEVWGYDGIENDFGIDAYNYNNKIIVGGIIKKSPADGKININDELLIKLDGGISQTKIDSLLKVKADESLKRRVSLKIVKNISKDTINFKLTAEPVRSNPYTDDPIKEIRFLTGFILFVADSMLSSNKNIKNDDLFITAYKDVIMSQLHRHYFLSTNDNKIPDSHFIKGILNLVESHSNLNFINKTIRHEHFIKDTTQLNYYYSLSDSLADIQILLQSNSLNSNQKHNLLDKRFSYYKQLDQLENYQIEQYQTEYIYPNFGFEQHSSALNKFDQIIRYVKTDYAGLQQIKWDKISDSFTTLNHSFNGLENDLLLFKKYIEKGVNSDYGKKEISAANKNTMFFWLEKLLLNFTDITSKVYGFDNGSLPRYSNDMDILDILVVPDGDFYFFPYELIAISLETEEGKPKSTNLVEVANVTYCPSLLSYVLLESKDTKAYTNNALLVSSNLETNSTVSYLNNLVLRSDYGNIKYVDTEIFSIDSTLSNMNTYNTKIYDSSNITEKAFKESDLENYKYIHIAAHGIHDNENPKYSGILLGRDESDDEDGLLQSHEIFSLNLNADLVVLSSCFSGFGEIDPNEGNLGIYRSFLIAGARSVIISLWNVEDESTSILFEKFYGYLMEGKSKSESLRLAKLYLKNDPRFFHPFYWAPFILIGEA